MKYYIDMFSNSVNKCGEELCGDHVEMARFDDSVIIVLSDGLGSGVKANILATLTSTIAITMLTAGLGLEETIDTIAHTLPECATRNLAYSTFTIIKIHDDGYVYVAEFDNPSFFLFDGSNRRNINKTQREISGKKIYESEFEMDANSLLVVTSDGAVHAGVGMYLNLGWQWENISEYLETLTTEKTAKSVVGQLLGVCETLYGDRPGDDTTVVAVKLKEPEVINIFTGPPKNKEDDSKVVQRILETEGQLILCGGTTANVVSRELNREINVDLSTMTEDIPPIAHMQGILLVTEGVLTLNKTIELLERYNNSKFDPEVLEKLEQNNGASILAKTLIEDCTHVNVWFGRAMNPAHQNADLSLNFNVKVRQIQQLLNVLRKLGKVARLIYV